MLLTAYLAWEYQLFNQNISLQLQFIFFIAITMSIYFSSVIKESIFEWLGWLLSFAELLLICWQALQFKYICLILGLILLILKLLDIFLLAFWLYTPWSRDVCSIVSWECRTTDGVQEILVDNNLFFQETKGWVFFFFWNIHLSSLLSLPFKVRKLLEGHLTFLSFLGFCVL